MTKRTGLLAAELPAASPGISAQPSMAMALQAAWLGPLGRYVGAGELVDVSGMAAGDAAALMAAGVLAPSGGSAQSGLGQETGPSGRDVVELSGLGQETGPSGRDVVELSGLGQETGPSGQVEAQPEAATIMQDEE